MPKINHTDRSKLVLGIDAGLAATGYGLIEEVDRKTMVRDWGVIRTSPKHPLPARLASLFQNLQELIDKEKPDEIAVEDGFFGKNVRSALVMGQTRGIALLAGALAGLPVHLYPPREVKLCVTGNGAASKEQVAFMIRRLLKIADEKIPPDSSDALAVALCRCQKRRFEEKTRRQVAGT